MVWRLALVGFVFGILALSLQLAARPVSGEVIDLLRAMVLGSWDSLVLSRAEVRPLTTVGHLASPPDEGFMQDDCDVDDDEFSDMLLLVLRAYVPRRALLCRSINGSPRAYLWPAHYFMRPQLLARL
jgi:hypothetical protein